MARQPARAVLIASRKFADEIFNFFAFRTQWDYGLRTCVGDSLGRTTVRAGIIL